MPVKVIVVVSGGNVQDCYADGADVEVEIIDFDNIEDEGSQAVQRTFARLKELTETMHQVY